MAIATAATIGIRHEGVGHKSGSTSYNNKYVFTGLPGWWVKLFYGGGGLAKYFGSDSPLIGVAYVVDGVRLSYPDLINRLDRFRYKYRFPRRWRKKVPKDWRRRSGVLIINIVDGVECLVRIRKGYVERFQVVGGVKSFDRLEHVVSFLKYVFGLHVSIDDVVSNVNAPYPDPNRLKSLSWVVARSAKDSWVPITGFGRWLSDKVSKRLEKNTWIEVVSSPRVGKSSGIILGLMRLVIEHGIDDYVVLIVVPNRRLGRQLYRYALGAWKRLLKDLRVLGWNAGMLSERIRIRYYEGMESSCLLGKRIHRSEDCKKCLLNKMYQSVWRKAYRFPVPVLDPVVLKVSGYCPFQILYNRVFWRNSFVIVHYRVLPLVKEVLKRFKFKRVVVYLDEYLEHVKSRVVFGKINVEEFDGKLLDLEVEYGGKKVRFRDVLELYNRFLENIVAAVFSSHESFAERLVVSRGPRNVWEWYSVFLEYVEKVFLREVPVPSSVVKDLFSQFKVIVSLLELFYSRYRLHVFKRFSRSLGFWWNSLFRVEFNGYGYRHVFDPDVTGSGVGSSPGGYVFSFVHSVSKSCKELYIITSSVEDSDFSNVKDAASRFYARIIAPYLRLRYSRLSVVYYRGVRGYSGGFWEKSPSRYAGSLRGLFELLRSGGRNVAVIIDKESMLRLAKMFERLGWEIKYGRDEENPEIIDYVVVERPSGSIVLMFHPHGRCSMGVDPPFKDRIESVVVALGVRSFPGRVAPIPRVFLEKLKGVLRSGQVVRVEGVPGAYAVVDVKRGVLYVYDYFLFKYDLHLMVQVVGRYFLSRSMFNVVLNPRYGVMDVRYFFLVYPFDEENAGYVVGRVVSVKYIEKRSGRVFSEYEMKISGLIPSDFSLNVKVVDINRFVKVDNTLIIDLNKVKYTMYNRLRNVYNSLRYVKKQLKYGRQPDKWWFVKKVVYLINGFEYARLERLPVPAGLKRAFERYVDGGLEGLLHYIYSRYLHGIDPSIWSFIKSYVKGFTRSWWWKLWQG